MADRIAKLVMVTEANNNKFYNMTEENGIIHIEYGRIDATSQKTSKPSSQWDKIYREKTKKGYTDVTELKTVKDKVTDAVKKVVKVFKDFFSWRKKEVVDIVNTLQGWAKGSIAENYSVSSKDVTQAQVDKAQELIDKMSNFDFTIETISDFNKILLEYYMVVPRKMKNVRDHILSQTLTGDSLKEEHAKLISKEQDTLDVMAGQVALDTAAEQELEDGDTTEVETDIIESSGLTFDLVEDQTIIDIIKDKMGPNAHQFRQAFEVRHLDNQNTFEKTKESFKNKSTELFWHGSRNENWWSIITTCLKIRPSNAVHTGSMFSDGIYFADKFQKSFGYTSGRSSYFAKGNSNNAVLALYEVLVGEQKHIYKHDSSCYSITKQKLLDEGGYNSVYAHGGADLRNNEYIIYDGNQCTMKYLVIVNA